jgi:hypothetical protein
MLEVQSDGDLAIAMNKWESADRNSALRIARRRI